MAKKSRHQIAADRSWMDTKDWAARTAKGRARFEAKFLEMADGDPKRAAKFREDHFRRMNEKSVASRKQAAENRKAERLAARQKLIKKLIKEQQKEQAEKDQAAGGAA